MHPTAHLWDNGTDAVAELRRVMAVRRVALDRFGEAAIRRGRPLATLEETLVPLFLHHRYQAEAAAKVLGGEEYSYAVRGDGQVPLRPVPGEAQRAALEALLVTIDPAELAMPASVLRLIPPRPFTFRPHRELFDRWTGIGFDAVSPAVAAADGTISLILHPERSARLVQQGALDRSRPSFEWTVDRLIDATFRARPRDPYHQEIGRGIERVVVERLMELASSAPMPQVRAVALQRRLLIRDRFGSPRGGAGGYAAHAALLHDEITRFVERPYDAAERIAPPAPPPGAPIGDGH